MQFARSISGLDQVSEAMECKNKVYIGRSLDGYIAGKKGELDWLDSIPNPDNEGMGYYEFMDEIDALVLGRRTFQTVLEFGSDWPYKKHVFVLSNSLNEIQDPLKESVSLLAGELKDIIATIRDKGFCNLYIDGGKLIQSFLKEDLIDEMTITTIPILLGGGIPLFGELEKPLLFDHVESKVFLGQLVQDRHVRRRSK